MVNLYQQKETASEYKPCLTGHRSNYFFVPLAIIIAGAMISGAVIYSNNKNVNLAEEAQRQIAQAPEKTEDPSKIYSVSVDDDPIKGNPNAKITIIEFSDFQCPFCKKVLPTIQKILENYSDKVKFVYRDFPLDFHNNAQIAAEASECADDQGKFWEYHNLLFGKQKEWEEADGVKKFKKYAESLKLDAEKFDQCLDSGKYEEEVKKDLSDGKKNGVSGTPAFFINGRKLVGAQPYEEFKKIIDEELNKL
jgi:protein-disulfide isomerase